MNNVEKKAKKIESGKFNMPDEYIHLIYLGSMDNEEEHLGFYRQKKIGDSHIYDSHVIINGKPTKAYSEGDLIHNDVNIELKNGWIHKINFKSL